LPIFALWAKESGEKEEWRSRGRGGELLKRGDEAKISHEFF
jgi:hypothetical protein